MAGVTDHDNPNSCDGKVYALGGKGNLVCAMLKLAKNLGCAHGKRPRGKVPIGDTPNPY